MKNKMIWLFIVLAGVSIFFVFKKDESVVVRGELKTEKQDEKILSRNGLHWHSELAVFVKGEKVEIPANLGLGTVHNPIHTHVEDAANGVIHMEFSSLVRQSNTKLGEFFKVWEKDINSFGKIITMKVNGVESVEFENYLMKDGDKIEIRYE